MKDLVVRRVGIVGAGTIGASWAAFYASRGIEVRIHDVEGSRQARGLEQARAHLRALVGFGLAGATDAGRDPALVAPAGTLAEAAQGADLVHESASERYEAKREIFARLDALTAPEVVLASSSSGLLMSRIQEPMRHPERALVAHPFNPPHLVPLVELVGGARTDPEVVARVHAFYARLGKIPVILRQEVPGHIANRLAAALWREALDLVARGVASVADVDRALCAGPGVRWAVMGQHLTYHLGGGSGGYAHFIDHIGQGWSALWQDMAAWTEIPGAAREAALAGIEEVVAGREASELVAWRDEQLAAVLRAVGRQALPPGPDADPA